ncbi:MAG TPA: DinB family protein [Longimicrobiaceae bacterium]|nr:DinB family protein [Longimicrobiaceae bacterium]
MSQAAATIATVRAPSFDDLDLELASTRRILEAVPDEHWTWKPHEKSMSLGGIANHLLDALHQAESPVQRDRLDLSEEQEQTAPSPGREQLLRRFDAQVEALRAGVAARDAIGWDGMWQLTRGADVVWAMPRALAFRVLISHLVHHRGQLSVYLRLLDIPVPGMYGPSADERGH